MPKTAIALFGDYSLVGKHTIDYLITIVVREVKGKQVPIPRV